MPTGYTAAIKNGITFNQFVMNCARAMGACIEMRDDPIDKTIPDEFKPSDYHVKALSKAQEKYDEFTTMSINQKKALYEQEKRYELLRRGEYQQEKRDLKNKYSEMLAKVVKWEPPTGDHKEFKKFMADQIRQSIDFDCSEYEYETYPEYDVWLSDYTSKLLRDIIYHTEEHSKEVERVNGRNRWIRQLRESLA